MYDFTVDRKKKLQAHIRSGVAVSKHDPVHSGNVKSYSGYEIYLLIAWLTSRKHACASDETGQSSCWSWASAGAEWPRHPHCSNFPVSAFESEIWADTISFSLVALIMGALYFGLARSVPNGLFSRAGLIFSSLIFVSLSAMATMPVIVAK